MERERAGDRITYPFFPEGEEVGPPYEKGSWLYVMWRKW